MKKHRNKIIFGAIIALILTLAFLWDGNTPSQPKVETEAPRIIAEEKPEDSKGFVEPTEPEKQETETPDVNNTEKQEPVNIEENNTVCSLTVRCDTVLDNLHNLKPEKQGIIPDNGIIYENSAAVFYEGETVFNVLSRELKKNKIHFEYEKTPMYNSVYIEGIGNLYEFDCGELSGWLYKVNGKTPGCGCSQYTLKDGDVVEFMYSCSLGADVGGYKKVSGE